VRDLLLTVAHGWAPARSKNLPMKASAFAPASIGNIGVGFDILGQSIEGPGDRATVSRIDAPIVRIAGIVGCADPLPIDPVRNTAGVALMRLRETLGLDFGFEIELLKGIPLGSGMGGSAASCVAALVAANALLDRPLEREALYPFAVDGEAVASGGRHGDNVGPMLIGGVVLATADRLLRLDTPPGLHCVLVHPHMQIETRRAREALQGHYALSEFTAQNAHLALFLTGLSPLPTPASTVTSGYRLWKARVRS
jgi:homoserine kinase